MYKPTLPHAKAAAIAHQGAEDLQVEAERIAEFLGIQGSAKKALLEARRACQHSSKPDAFDPSVCDLAATAEQRLREWAQHLEKLQRTAVHNAADFMRVSTTYLEMQAWHLSRLKAG